MQADTTDIAGHEARTPRERAGLLIVEKIKRRHPGARIEHEFYDYGFHLAVAIYRPDQSEPFVQRFDLYEG